MASDNLLRYVTYEIQKHFMSSNLPCHWTESGKLCSFAEIDFFTHWCACIKGENCCRSVLWTKTSRVESLIKMFSDLGIVEQWYLYQFELKACSRNCLYNSRQILQQAPVCCPAHDDIKRDFHTMAKGTKATKFVVFLSVSQLPYSIQHVSGIVPWKWFWHLTQATHTQVASMFNCSKKTGLQISRTRFEQKGKGTFIDFYGWLISRLREIINLNDHEKIFKNFKESIFLPPSIILIVFIVLPCESYENWNYFES